MSKQLVVLVAVVACLCLLAASAEAQLTFTSSWGKRGAVAASMSCRSDETLAAIYKLIQNEAERLVICQKP